MSLAAFHTANCCRVAVLMAEDSRGGVGRERGHLNQETLRMPRFIECLEDRVLMSVSSAQLQADSQALVGATAAANAALNTLHSAQIGLFKAVASGLKAGQFGLSHAARAFQPRL